MGIRTVLTATLLGAAITLLVCSHAHGREKYPVRQLTSDQAQEGFPDWSPDGRWIVYETIDRAKEDSRTGLWKIPVEGGDPLRVTSVIGEHPDWSPDGRTIVFDADSGKAVDTVSADGGTPVRLVPDSVEVYQGGNPRWSPDGSRIAFRSRSSLQVLNVKSGALDTVLRQEGALTIPGCWSLDGRELYVIVRDAAPPASRVRLVGVESGEGRTLTGDTGLSYRYVDLSPDGTMLAFVMCEGRSCDIWVMPAEGTAQGGHASQVTFDPAYDDTPRWSPDGKRIAFTSTRSGNFDVWVIEPDLELLRAEMLEQK